MMSPIKSYVPLKFPEQDARSKERHLERGALSPLLMSNSRSLSPKVVLRLGFDSFTTEEREGLIKDSYKTGRR